MGHIWLYVRSFVGHIRIVLWVKWINRCDPWPLSTLTSTWLKELLKDEGWHAIWPYRTETCHRGCVGHRGTGKPIWMYVCVYTQHHAYEAIPVFRKTRVLCRLHPPLSAAGHQGKRHTTYNYVAIHSIITTGKCICYILIAACNIQYKANLQRDDMVVPSVDVHL